MTDKYTETRVNRIMMLLPIIAELTPPDIEVFHDPLERQAYMKAARLVPYSLLSFQSHGVRPLTQQATLKTIAALLRSMRRYAANHATPDTALTRLTAALADCLIAPTDPAMSFAGTSSNGIPWAEWIALHAYYARPASRATDTLDDYTPTPDDPATTPETPRTPTAAQRHHAQREQEKTQVRADLLVRFLVHIAVTRRWWYPHITEIETMMARAAAGLRHWDDIGRGINRTRQGRLKKPHYTAETIRDAAADLIVQRAREEDWPPQMTLALSQRLSKIYDEALNPTDVLHRCPEWMRLPEAPSIRTPTLRTWADRPQYNTNQHYPTP